MYQSIDDPQDELDALERGDKRMVIWAVAVTCLALIGALIYWTNSGPETKTEDDSFLRAEQTTYRRAVSELAAPMRRARLQDFLTTYPESHYKRAVEAQLDVINLHETQRWQEVNDIVFAPRISQDEKITALDNFEAKWGGALLGGRDDDISALRKDLMQMEDSANIPSRKLKDLKSPIPVTVPDTQLAGGPRPAAPPPITRPAPQPPKTITTVKRNIVPPSARRNVKPRYPRKAMRRKVDALVVLKLNIDEKGRVAMTELVEVQAERYEKDFIRAAERAAMRTRFNPQTVDGKPQAAVGVVRRYRFDPGA
ncbi:TonB family protein [Hellea balneolensis]|uniref:TonB family protein n=1 Tax=Hellea balneolensis TaxID=287478 RepID=UPI0003F85073|nr:TonB family protein [Hellea balneolensis]